MARQVVARKAERTDGNARPMRERILAAATRVFLDAGYGFASMDRVARAAGVSKQTIYAHFGGKAQLFEAIISENAERTLGALPTGAVAAGDPRTALETVARRLLDVILSPEALARFRVVVAESGRFPELAEVYYRAGAERVTNGLANYLARLAGDGVIQVRDPHLAAGQFLGMVWCDAFIRALFRIGEPPSPVERDRIVGTAVDVFLAAHRS